MIAGIKDIDALPVGDTITEDARPAPAPLPGFQRVKPRVFAGLFPVDSSRCRTTAPVFVMSLMVSVMRAENILLLTS